MVTATVTQLTAASLATACHHTNQTDQHSRGCRDRTITLTLKLLGAHRGSGHWKRTPVQRRTDMLSLKAQWTELESTLLMNFSFLLVIYIFVTIQLLNVCLVLFLTLLYIRTQRWLVLKQPVWAVDIDILHILTYFIDWPFCSATH